jgi:hypothetical protein
MINHTITPFRMHVADASSLTLVVFVVSAFAEYSTTQVVQKVVRDLTDAEGSKRPDPGFDGFDKYQVSVLFSLFIGTCLKYAKQIEKENEQIFNLTNLDLYSILKGFV